MKTKFKEFLLKQEEQQRTTLILLESYLDNKMSSKLSMLPFFQALAPLMVPEMRVAHRVIESFKNLQYYTDRENGLIWQDPATMDAQIIYLSFHGLESGKIQTQLNDISLDEMIEAFKGHDDKLLFFQACSLFRDEANAKKFLSETGVRAIAGYSEDFWTLDGIVTAYLFLNLFDSFLDPFNHLEEIYQSVIIAFPIAWGYGFKLFQ